MKKMGFSNKADSGVPTYPKYEYFENELGEKNIMSFLKMINPIDGNVYKIMMRKANDSSETSKEEFLKQFEHECQVVLDQTKDFPAAMRFENKWGWIPNEMICRSRDNNQEGKFVY